MHTALWSHHSGISTICLPFMWENEISFEVLYKQSSMIRSQGFPSTVKESPQLCSEGHQAPAHHTPILDITRKKAGHPTPMYLLRLGLLGDVPNGGTFFSYNGSNKLGGNQQAQRQVTGFRLGYWSWRRLPGWAPLPWSPAPSELQWGILLGGCFIRDVGDLQGEVL